MATSKVPAVIDYLVATFTAAATLGQATPPVSVYDGPFLQQTPTTLNLYVGLSDPDADEPVGANSEQTWAALGKQAIDEQLSVHCCAEAWSGDTALQPARVAAYQILAAVETIIRGDVMLGGLVLFCEPVAGGAELRQDQTDLGARVKVLFRIDAKARL